MTAETTISILLALFVVGLLALGYRSWRNARRKEDATGERRTIGSDGGPVEPP